MHLLNSKCFLDTVYYNPDIEPERVQQAMIGFLTGIKGKLKSKSVDPNSP